jgi:hypothetical protein
MEWDWVGADEFWKHYSRMGNLCIDSLDGFDTTFLGP